MDTFSQYELTSIPPGIKLFCGVDEAGRGPLAGPVVAAAVIFPPGIILPGVADS
ncbi:MAG: ribonuclease HII, partial [FCB group bacterium]|nr:ribonuclease HII [FCB group bacterium]